LRASQRYSGRRRHPQRIALNEGDAEEDCEVTPPRKPARHAAASLIGTSYYHMNRPRATGKTWEFKDDAEESAKAICGMWTNGILSLREVNGAGQIEKNWLHIGAFVRDLRFSGGREGSGQL